MQIKSIRERYVLLLSAYETKSDTIQNRIDQLENKLTWNRNRSSKLYLEKHPYWLDEIIDPIAQLMAKHFPDRTYNILGPFGIDCRTSIHFYKKGIAEEERFSGDNCLSITFVPGDLHKGDIMVEDTTTDIGKFAKGTLGEVNGMNHPKIDIPDNANEQWLINWMMEQNKED